jgi:hypothetical protein
LATAVGLATVEIPTTILPSAGTPSATEPPKTVYRQQFMTFWRNLRENSSERQKICEIRHKKSKNGPFLAERFWSVR